MFDIWSGPLMDAAGDAGGGGAAVADTGGDYGDGSAGDSTQETGAGEVHEAEFVDPGTDVAVREPGQIKVGERAVQNGRFTQSGRTAIESLRTLSPRIAQEFTQAILTRDWFLKEFPGGKKDVQQLRALAQQHGGEQGISELQSIADQMEEIDRLYAASDPSFLDKITEDEDGQRAFVGLMIPALNKFDKLAPAQLAHYQANGFKRVMDGAGVPTLFATQAAILNRAGKALAAGNADLASSFLSEIIENHNAIHAFVDGIYQRANEQPPAFGSASDPRVQDRERQLSEKEKALQKTEWGMTVANERRRIFSKAWNDLTKGRNLTSDQDSTVKGFYELRLSAKIKQWQNQAVRFEANGDKDGYLKEQFTFFQRAIPEALRQAIQQALPRKPGPKAQPNTPLRPPVNGQRQAATPGTVRVAKMPQNLDPVRTTEAMLRENKAYGRDGKIYQWA